MSTPVAHLACPTTATHPAGGRLRRLRHRHSQRGGTLRGMSGTKHHSAADFSVEDPAAAFQKFEDFTRRVLAVPKKKIDAKLALARKKKAKKRKQN